MKLNETEFTEKLHKALQKELKGYEVKKNEALIYKVIINEEMRYIPTNPKEPKRGSLAFQTDLVIKKNNLPLVVVETKVGRKSKEFSTHDVLTYSTKALKHKEVYPHLRYGLVVGNACNIAKRFFTHNQGFDFALAIEDVNDLNDLKTFIDSVKKQISSSEKFLKILKEKNKTKLFSLNLEVENV